MMGNYEQLKAAVASIVRYNGAEEITGNVLQSVLISIINSVGSGAVFAGIATPSTSPSNPDPNMFYIAVEAGTYPNFNLTVTTGMCIFSNESGTWVGHELGVSSQFESGEYITDVSITDTLEGAETDNLPTVGAINEAVTALNTAIATERQDRQEADGNQTVALNLEKTLRQQGDEANAASVGYYVCDTAAATAAKVVNASGYVLRIGGNIRIEMTNANTASNVTLNVNSTGAKALFYNGTQASADNSWADGEVLEVYYDGTQYQCASGGGGGKFASGEKLSDTRIVDSLSVGGSTDVFSAEKGKELADLCLSLELHEMTITMHSGSGYLNDSGVFTSYGSGNNVSDFIAVTAGEIYAVTASSKNFASSLYCCFGYSDATEASMVQPFLSRKQTYVNEPILIPNGVNYIRIGYGGGTPKIYSTTYVSKADVVGEDVNELRAEMGELEKYTFYPNHLSFEVAEQGKIFMNTGSLYNLTGSVVTDFIAVTPKQKLHLVGGSNGNVNFRVGAWYDINKTYITIIPHQYLSAFNTTEVVVPDNAYYMRLSGNKFILDASTPIDETVATLELSMFGLLPLPVENGQSDGHGGISNPTDARYKHVVVDMLEGERYMVKIFNTAVNVKNPFVLYNSANGTYETSSVNPAVPEYFTAPYDGKFWVSGTSSNNPTRVNIEVYKYGAYVGSKRYLPKVIHTVGHSFWFNDGATKTQFGVTFTLQGFQTLFQQQFKFDSLVSLAYDGHSLGATSDSDTSSIALKLGTWTGTAGDIWTLDTVTNDFRRNITLGTLTDFNDGTGATTYYGALRVFADKVAELSGSTAIVIVANATHRNNAGYTSTSTNSAGCTLLDYSNALSCISVVKGWYFVDAFNYGGLFDDNLSYTTLDGLHPNNLGYSLIVKEWLKVLDIVYNKLLG